MTPQQLAQLHARCFQTPRPWNEQEFKDLLSSPQVFLCSSVDGFALGRIAGPEAELLTLAVDPKARRQGQGAALVKAFCTKARSLGAQDVFLEVARDNHAANALYAVEGFGAAGIRKDYYATPDGKSVTAFVLRKTFP